MIFDDLGWSLMIIRNYDFLMILSDFVTCTTWRRVLRTLSLSERECPKSTISQPHVVRSILLQVTGGRQIAYRGFLLSVLPDPLWSTISQPHVNQMKNSRHESPSFLMYFHMVFTRVPEHTGYIATPARFLKIMKHHGKLMIMNTSEDHSGEV